MRSGLDTLVGAESLVTLEIGQVIDDKYRIVRLLGEGGMGAVYEGENTRIRRRVAIKVLNTDFATNTELVARFEREAQAAGQIGNDHILEVLDLGTLPDGIRYMVLEYLDGETLLDRIKRYGRLTPEQIVPLARQFLSALEAAHSAGIIHRDLKPENIFILREKAGRKDFVKLIDFGVSKFDNLDPGTFRVTRAGTLIGTPSYMAPEQARGLGEADVRSDIYGVGVILYEAVTGKLPFDDCTSFNDLLFKIALSDPPPPRERVPGLDPDFERILMKAMARDRNARYESVQVLCDALEDWAIERDVPLSLAPARSPRRLSIPDEIPKRPPSEAQTETVVALTVGSAEGSGAYPNAQANLVGPPGEPALPLGFSPKRMAILAGAISIGVIGLVLMALSMSSPKKKPVGLTAEAAEASAEVSPPPEETPPATTAFAMAEATDEAIDAGVEVSSPEATNATPRPIPHAAKSAAAKAKPPPPKASAKAPKTTTPDFGY